MLLLHTQAGLSAKQLWVHKPFQGLLCDTADTINHYATETRKGWGTPNTTQYTHRIKVVGNTLVHGHLMPQITINSKFDMALTRIVKMGLTH